MVALQVADGFLQILTLLINQFVCQRDHQQRDPKPRAPSHCGGFCHWSLFVDLPAVSPDILVLGMVGNTSPHDDGYKGVRKAMQKLSDKQPEYLR